MNVESIQVNIPIGWVFDRFDTPEIGEIVVRSGGLIADVTQYSPHAQVIVRRVEDSPHEFPSYIKRGIFAACDEKPVPRWYFYFSDERTPTWNQETRQWSGDTILRMDVVAQLIPSFKVPPIPADFSQSLVRVS